MTATLSIDKAGRVVLPKLARDEMQLRSGDTLELESLGDRILLRPRRRGVGLHRKQGVWVLSTGRPISAEASDMVLREIRDEANSDLWEISHRVSRDGKSGGEIYVGGGLDSNRRADLLLLLLLFVIDAGVTSLKNRPRLNDDSRRKLCRRRRV